MTKATILPALAAAALLGLSSAAGAATITPVSVTASNTFPLWGEYNAQNLIDGSGMVGDLHGANYGDMWMTDLGVDAATLTFDLGQLYDLAGMTAWNYNFGDPGYFTTLDRAANAFSVAISTDGISFTDVLSGNFAKGTGQLLAGETFSLAGAARYVRLELTGNHQQWPDTYGYAPVGLSEVRFSSAVPEPSAWALMIAGFGLAGAALRRRSMLPVCS